MKWVLSVLGGIVVLIAVVYVVGASLPEAHIATRAAKFERPPQVIWEAITDFERSADWNTLFESVERLPDRNGHSAWLFRSSQGDMPMEVAEFDTTKRLVTEIIEGDLPFGGRWIYELVEENGGTLLTITEDGKIYNPFFRFMARFIFGYHSTMEAYLKDLGRKFGEEVDIIETPS
ncbi:MAG: SRPBCC family protein [bacterium]